MRVSGCDRGTSGRGGVGDGRGRGVMPPAGALVTHLGNLVATLDDATDPAEGDARRQEAEEPSERGDHDGEAVAA